MKMTKKSKIEGRKWEDLQIDCLVNILGRVGIESLIIDVPFVCKSWYKATLHPFCWKQLHFPYINDEQWNSTPFVYRFSDRFRLEDPICLFECKLVKGVIDRSAGFATTVDLGFCFEIDKELIDYVADNCPALKNLVVWVEREKFLKDDLTLVTRKLKNLESLENTCPLQFKLKDLITEIGSHCVNFASLKLVGFHVHKYEYLHDIHEYDTHKDDTHEDVRAIVTSLPKLKFLALKNVCIDREDVIKIIKGCTSLVCLDVRDCRGFDEHDEELSKLASHIPTFLCTGSFANTRMCLDVRDCRGFDEHDEEI